MHLSQINAFYAEIQDGRQKGQESYYCENSPVDSEDTLRGKNFVEKSLSRTVSEINALYLRLIQDGRQKWQECDFWEKSPADSADTVHFKYFVKIALSRTVSKINAFLHFTQKFKMAAKIWRECNFWNTRH